MLGFYNVHKTYVRRGAATKALDGLTVSVSAGEFVAVVGPSGSGKSTLLHLAAALDLPTEGRVHIDGRNVAEMTETERTRLRRYHIGLVFQFFNLMPTLTLERNIALPLLLDGQPLATVLSRVRMLLERIGLADRAHAYPDELSGGQMQRVAIARALVTEPKLLLADEPTGNLDSATSREIMALIRETSAESRRTTLLVTHDMQVAAMADRIVHIRDGRVEDDRRTGVTLPGVLAP
ncbi:MAG: ABC transporter ATP-binding protein [Planctomycetota bacterium]|nr:MAG: ABC transporter ATP-binding protein [Planctomycetota bacterium]